MHENGRELSAGASGQASSIRCSQSCPSTASGRAPACSAYQPFGIFQLRFSICFLPFTMAFACCGPCTVSAKLTSDAKPSCTLATPFWCCGFPEYLCRGSSLAREMLLCECSSNVFKASPWFVRHNPPLQVSGDFHHHASSPQLQSDPSASAARQRRIHTGCARCTKCSHYGSSRQAE